MPDSSNDAPSHHRQGDSRAPVVVSGLALAVALAAAGLAAWGLLDDRSPAAPQYTDAQRQDAKTRACAAFDVVRRGITLNTNQQAPGGEGDVTGALAVAANARVSLYDGGQYLLARLDPAAPADLADAVRRFADDITDIGAYATAGVPNTDAAQAGRLQEADRLNGSISQMCG